ncbi:hypothetical protein KY363_07520 [Candidatus Woesearchaeota archaeon]|nr:hypothetical protein [Candidatus Woesearchaeota archaeon]
MVEYRIIVNFSEDARPRGIAKKLAEDYGRYFLSHLELERFIPPDSRLTATVLADENGEVSEVTIAQTTGFIKGIDKLLQKIVQEDFCTTPEDTPKDEYQFYRAIGPRKVLFRMLAIDFRDNAIPDDAPAYTLEMHRPVPKQTLPKPANFRPEKKKTEPANAMPSKEEPKPEQALEQILAGVKTSKGTRATYHFTLQGRMIAADIYPPRGEMITEYARPPEAKPDLRQVRGVIAYSTPESRVRIHRRHPAEKFDVRGRMGKDSAMHFVAIDYKEEDITRLYEALTQLPVKVESSDGSELTVVYDKNTVFICPKGEATVTVSGYEEAVAQKKAIPRPRDSKTTRNFLTPCNEQEFVVFTSQSKLRSMLEETGGSGRKDVFDEFYDRYLAERKDGQ